MSLFHYDIYDENVSEHEFVDNSPLLYRSQVSYMKSKASAPDVIHSKDDMKIAGIPERVKTRTIIGEDKRLQEFDLAEEVYEITAQVVKTAPIVITFVTIGFGFYILQKLFM